MTGEHLAVLNGYVLVGNNAVEIYVITGISILHKDGVLNNRSLAHSYTSEKDGIFKF